MQDTWHLKRGQEGGVLGIVLWRVDKGKKVLTRTESRIDISWLGVGVSKGGNRF